MESNSGDNIKKRQLQDKILKELEYYRNRVENSAIMKLNNEYDFGRMRAFEQVLLWLDEKE